MTPHARTLLGLAATLLLFAGATFAPAQNHDGPPLPPDPAHHAGGRIAAIAGTTITVSHLDGSTQDIVVTDTTTYAFEHHPAALADFSAGNFLGAEGERDADGRFVAEHVFGGAEPPRPPHGFPPDPEHHVGGKVVSVDTTSGTLTVARPDGETDVIQTTAATTFDRNRQPATLGDFKTDDHAMAHGERDASGAFVADHVGGGDRKPERHN